LGASLELLNLRDTLCKLKEEIDVGLGTIDLVLNNVEKSGLGQGVKGPIVPHVMIHKGKEKIGLEGKGPQTLTRFKAKKKVVFFKPKAGVGLGVGQNRRLGCSGFSGRRLSPCSLVKTKS
jgi:hypothetical protein